jgi:hypothetical protein
LSKRLPLSLSFLVFTSLDERRLLRERLDSEEEEEEEE